MCAQGNIDIDHQMRKQYMCISNSRSEDPRSIERTAAADAARHEKMFYLFPEKAPLETGAHSKCI